MEVEINIKMIDEEKVRKYDEMNITRYPKLVGNRSTSVCMHVGL